MKQRKQYTKEFKQSAVPSRAPLFLMPQLAWQSLPGAFRAGSGLLKRMVIRLFVVTAILALKSRRS